MQSLFLKIKLLVSVFFISLRRFASAHNSFVYIGFYKYFYKPTKGSISDFLNHYSKQRGEGFTVIQIGANDGMLHDPIHKFIKRDQWNGVLLEPQKYVFDKYLRKIYQRNPGIKLLNAALGYNDGSATLYKIGFSNARWATGLASFNRTHLENAFDSGIVREKVRKAQIKITPDPDKHIVEEPIEVICTQSLLERYALNKIDLLQIDTEGFDYEIIKMFNIEKTKPQCIIFEISHLSETDLSSCLYHLQKNGYQSKSMGANMVAMHNPPHDLISFFN